MNERLRRLQAQRGKAIADARAILDQADGEKRGLTPEEEERYTRLDEEYDKLTHAIEQEGRLAQREKAAHESFSGLDNPQQRRQPGQALEGSAPNDGPEYRKAMLGYLVSGRMDGLMLDGIDEKRTILGIGLSGGSSGAVSYTHLGPAACTGLKMCIERWGGPPPTWTISTCGTFGARACPWTSWRPS